MRSGAWGKSFSHPGTPNSSCAQPGWAPAVSSPPLPATLPAPAASSRSPGSRQPVPAGALGRASGTAEPLGAPRGRGDPGRRWKSPTLPPTPNRGPGPRAGCRLKASTRSRQRDREPPRGSGMGSAQPPMGPGSRVAATGTLAQPGEAETKIQPSPGSPQPLPAGGCNKSPTCLGRPLQQPPREPRPHARPAAAAALV